jgi:hypothetical protein
VIFDEVREKWGVVEGLFFGGGGLEDCGPLGDCCSLKGWVLKGAALDSFEEHFVGRGEDVRFDGCAEGAGCESEFVPFGLGPSAPFDDDD